MTEPDPVSEKRKKERKNRVFLLTVPNRRYTLLCQAEPCQEAPRVRQVAKKKQGKTMSRDFFVAFVVRNYQSKASIFMIGQFEEFQWALGCKGCPELLGPWPRFI